MKNRKMTWITMIAAMMVFTFVTAYGANKEQLLKREAPKHELSNYMINMSRAVGELQQNKGLQAVLNSYMQIKNALVADNSEQVQKAAASIQKAIKETDSNEVGEEIKNAVRQLAEAQDIKSQRKYFAQLSDQLYQVVKDSDTLDKTLYWQHCPMALNNQGANWLSYDEQVQNPFMGQKMPTCGSVEETLNQ